jgi:hypothetical protein
MVYNTTGSALNLNGGTITAGSLNLSGNSGLLNWTAGTLNLTNSSLTVGSGGTLGSSMTLGSGQTLDISGSGQSLTVTGTMNVNGGGLSAPSITQSAGSFTDTGTLLLASTGGNAVTYNLNGGTLSTGSLSVATSGAFNWTSGTLNLTNSSLTVGSGGALGSSLTLGNGQTLDISGSGQNLAVTGTMNVNGGGLSVSTIAQSAGTVTDTGTMALASTGGNAVTYNLSGGSASVSGRLQVNGGGSLTQSGSGSLTAGSITLAGGTITQNTAGSIVTSSLTQTSGTLIVPSLTPGSGGIGSYNWSGGTFHVTASNLEIGASGLFGSSLSLPARQTLIEDVGVTVDPGSSLNVQGGGLTISTGAAMTNSGTFNETSGSLTVNGAERRVGVRPAYSLTWRERRRSITRSIPAGPGRSST